MLSVLIKFVFTIITKLFGLILSPILGIIIALFPDLGTIITNVLNFLTTYCFTYISFGVRMLENLTFLPHTLIVFLFDYFLIKYTIYLTLQAVKFGITVYNKFKI